MTLFPIWGSFGGSSLKILYILVPCHPARETITAIWYRFYRHIACFKIIWSKLCQRERIIN
jgi:hypothetical protein